MKLIANDLRKIVLKMVYDKQSGHIGGSFSIAELVSYLYNNFELLSEDGDKLILSKGHAVPILYAALYELGVLSDDDLEKFREIDSPLQGHPDKLRLPQMHATTGALGQGLSIAIGHALAFQLKGSPNKAFCILGDGELQEVQIWEALMLAPKYKLNNLVCFIDHNGAQNDGLVSDILRVEPIDEKVSTFGWYTLRIDGNDYDAIADAIDNVPEDNELPICIVMDTDKGSGVSFMKDPAWHAKVPNEEEYKQAMEELS